MKTVLIQILTLLILVSCQSKKSQWYLIKNYDQVSKYKPFGYTSGYVNQNADTIIPLDKYARCFTDTVKYYAIVYDKKQGLIGIDLNETKLFNAVWNGEGSEVKESEGMILIVENKKYGFANNKGEIIIEPKYKCAESFKNGKAKVSNNCLESDDEYLKWKMNTWTFIDKNGNEIK
ncbi:WG repeat-containing protein [Psychroserpens sp.]|uniref:WG repeat-containing protein n=1 Tax=Psychroserpens sp. TaxID=2020870 RepID=UPI001B19B0E9|nr:WG repeat-containing protein [Psychroserpens sp.]MBO6606662.1 WG repeat-containing protein [Psychroserpens sp.]MBO6631992.1 WG repeat-containing protein [Psychroserpens sp.]MBO6653366.1 WG repeat-containing protein [Psychroserpens sp.]MBO6680607.1 WG repeat-containing protein [Psychroserpens sp.]MBO6750435.1 WG repeat-containing protein [Psychroserpens sp.]